jgi:hypothetical protein
MIHRDSFHDCAHRNIWGNMKIQLLDTTFWPHLTEDPERFGERYRTRVNLLEYDFVVMPIFEAYVFDCFDKSYHSNLVIRNHWRLGIIEKPGELMKGNT